MSLKLIVPVVSEMKACIPLIIAAVLLAGGCSKKEEARPVAPKPSLMKPGESLLPIVPTPPLPAINVPKGAAVDPGPHVGQAGDESSPGFKGGGVPDKNK